MVGKEHGCCGLPTGERGGAQWVIRRQPGERVPRPCFSGAPELLLLRASVPSSTEELCEDVAPTPPTAHGVSPLVAKCPCRRSTADPPTNRAIKAAFTKRSSACGRLNRAGRSLGACPRCSTTRRSRQEAPELTPTHTEKESQNICERVPGASASRSTVPK